MLSDFSKLWEGEDAKTPDVFAFLRDRSTRPDDQLEVLLIDQHHRWRRGISVPLVEYLEACPGVAANDSLRSELLVEEFGYREHYQGATGVDDFLDELQIPAGDFRNAIRLRLDGNTGTDTTPTAGEPRHGTPIRTTDTSVPSQVGRYEIERQLGAGSFGRVYLARDGELSRHVAVKMPAPERVTRAGGADEFLREARLAAGIDHPGIVPVYDVGVTDDGRCYIVTRYIEGGSLADLMRDHFSHRGSARLVAAVARALHEAHRCGIVHRDIKPANILIDSGGNPWIVDFGLALVDVDVRVEGQLVGTPAWMSPEQARGEGHRVDPRSDIYSLGVILFELLTGRRPFDAPTTDAMLDMLRRDEARPPRQHDDSIPRALDRICLKALSRRLSDRYSTALDMASDLEWYLNQTESGGSDIESSELSDVEPGGSVSRPAAGTTAPDDSGRQPLRVVPRGLRSFGAEDAAFFNELLPGPVGPDGLPDLVHFWKKKIEQRDSDQTFAVGLLYGPSGCGKSSLLKAGVLPCLASDVHPVYVESSASGTEPALLRQLRKLAPEAVDLTSSLQSLRRHSGSAKVVIILDQFEQWLHAWERHEDQELIEALRQCDGGHAQCVLLVRDDFWMATTRFMRELDIPLVERQNSAGVDLFDRKHACRVLLEFGRAYQMVPDRPHDPSPENQSFVEQAVDALADDGRIVPVRLSLFAEMVKGRAWHPDTLTELGGVRGVGVRFLEESFGETGPPQYRLHAGAARLLLQSLLPAMGSNIRGNARVPGELQSAAGYANRSADFDELIRILDQELRLITPADTESAATGTDADSTTTQRYQLTHDYLVPSLREWLTRRERSTIAGRLRLRLRERADEWNQKPEPRRLPSLWEFAAFRLLTSSKRWTTPQRRMMRSATLFHVAISSIVILILGFAGWGGYEYLGRSQSARLLGILLEAKTVEVPAIVDEMAGYRRWLDPVLPNIDVTQGRTMTEEETRRRRTNVALARLPTDPSQATYLVGRMLGSDPSEFAVFVHALEAHGTNLKDDLWREFTNPASHPERRLRAASALASFDPHGQQWHSEGAVAAGLLVRAPPSRLGNFIDSLRPVSASLKPRLRELFASRALSDREVAAVLLAEFSADETEQLTALALDADSAQLEALAPALLRQSAAATPLLESAWQEPSDPDDGMAVRRRANAAALLARMQVEEPFVSHLAAGEDNTLRTLLIHQYGPAGGAADRLRRIYTETSDVTVRQAVLQAMGGVHRDRLTSETQQALADWLADILENDPDPGVHASAEWVLRQWGLSGRIHEIAKRLMTGTPEGDRRWYHTTQGHTMVILSGPDEFQFGSPESEAGRGANEPVASIRAIPRTFAMSSHEVTMEQYQAFLKDNPEAPPAGSVLPTETPYGPAVGVDWFTAAWYCNWLCEKEGIPDSEWCYLPNDDGKYDVGMAMAAGRKQRTGYQLPAPLFWQYACRAGTTTSRYFGRSTDLLRQYGWFTANSNDSARATGLLKPNAFGLFDMYGNASEWQGWRRDKRDDDFDYSDRQIRIGEGTSMRVLGGAFRLNDRSIRSSTFRYAFTPSRNDAATGIRLVRNMPASSPDD